MGRTGSIQPKRQFTMARMTGHKRTRNLNITKIQVATAQPSENRRSLEGKLAE